MMIVYHLRFERIVLLVFPHTEMLLNRNQHNTQPKQTLRRTSQTTKIAYFSLFGYIIDFLRPCFDTASA